MSDTLRHPSIALMYGTRELTREPVGTTLNALAQSLAAGNHITAVLEPGDWTRYELMLLPLWAPRYANLADMFHIGTEDRGSTVLAIRVNGGRDCVSTILDLDGWYGDAVHLLSGGHSWTATVLRWWFNELAHELETNV